jgi:hypothetical protein
MHAPTDALLSLPTCRVPYLPAVSLELFARRDEDFLAFFAGPELKAPPSTLNPSARTCDLKP